MGGQHSNFYIIKTWFAAGLQDLYYMFPLCLQDVEAYVMKIFNKRFFSMSYIYSSFLWPETLVRWGGGRYAFILIEDTMLKTHFVCYMFRSKRRLIFNDSVNIIYKFWHLTPRNLWGLKFKMFILPISLKILHN